MNTMKNLLIVAFMFTLFMGYANDLKTKRTAANVTTVTFKNVKKGHLLTIKDNTSAILYSEQVQLAGNYIQHFNLTTLLNGLYTIELDKDSEILIKYFNVKNGVIIFDASRESSFFKPTTNLKNDLLYVSQLASSSDAILDVQIYYNNTLIHEDQLTNSAVLKRIYKIDTTKKGEYIVLMKSNDREFYKSYVL